MFLNLMSISGSFDFFVIFFFTIVIVMSRKYIRVFVEGLVF